MSLVNFDKIWSGQQLENKQSLQKQSKKDKKQKSENKMYSQSLQSSINISQSHGDLTATNLSLYQTLSKQYIKTGFTYKSNQILHKIAQKHTRSNPYSLILSVAKIYHMNQFQIIFFTHILNDRPFYEHVDHEGIFVSNNVKFPEEVEKMLREVEQEYQDGKGWIAEDILKQEYEGENMNEENEEDVRAVTEEELKKIYLYLLVIGYAIKYYLNQPFKAKPYQQHVNKYIEGFIPNIFNKWARKYGNTVLLTTPRKINGYYMGLGFLEGEEETGAEQQGEDCQYRNYNEIVEELIKATMTEVDEQQIGQQNLEDPAQE